MLHVHFSSAFLPQIGAQDIEITEGISTLRDLFAYLSIHFPAWAEEVGLEGDTPDYNLLTAINGQLASSLQGLDTPFHDGDCVEFHLLLTGG